MVKRYALVEGSYDAGDHMSDDDESYRQAAAEDRYVLASDFDALVELCKDVGLFNCTDELKEWQRLVSALVGFDIEVKP
jgi:hypothetical protein